jgi:thymidine kinase
MTPRESGRIEVITGPMFSGKSEELIRRLRRAQLARQPVQVFKHQVDLRYSAEHVVSHSEWRIPSQAVATAGEILSGLAADTRVVGIDEAQFFERDLVEKIGEMAGRGLRVIVAGLNLNYLGRPFGSMPWLLAMAEEVTKLHAICMVCGAPAHFTHRLGAGRESVLVGAAEAYEARCRACFPPALSSRDEPAAETG